MLVLPWHLSDALPEDLGAAGTAGTVVAGAPARTGDPWRDLAVLYQPLAEAVATAALPVTVLSGDCVSALAVLAGLQRRGLAPELVWVDAHGDFHTEETTASGYLGGLPLAKAVGRGDPTLPRALGMRPLDERSVLLADARDLDPPEAAALAASRVRRATLDRLAEEPPRGRPVHLHVDLDVLDPALLPGLRFPAAGGTDHAALTRALRAVLGGGGVAAVSIAATWRPEATRAPAAQRAIAAVVDALGQRR